MTCIRYLLLALAISVFTDSLAQNDSLTYELSEIVVSTNRIQLPYAEETRSIILKSANEIKKAPVNSVAGMLHYVAGVDVRSRGVNGVQADVGIRGGTFDQTLILVNGIKISDMQTGHHSLNLPLDITHVERIEVVKGPAARVYGQNAFSGAINIVTKSPEQSSLTMQVTGGDFALFGGKIAGAIKKEKQEHYLSFNYDRSAGYKYNTDYEMLNIYYQGGIQLGNGKLSLMGGLTDRSFGANGFYASPAFTEQYESVLTGLGALSYSTLINDEATLESRLYFRTNNDDYVFLRDNPDFYHNTHVNNTIGFEINSTIPNAWGITGIGVDFNRVTLTSNNLGDRSRFVATLFLEHRFAWAGDRFTLTPGVQLNNYSDFGFIALPGIDFGYKINASLAAFASLGYTYRVPTFTDLYYSDPVNLGNPDLQPEYAWTYELGLKSTRKAGIVAQVSLFYRNGQDIIDWLRQSDNDPWQPVNILNVNMAGVDSNLSLLVNELSGNPLSFLQRVDLNYTFINSTSVSTEAVQSRYALENLRHQLSAGLFIRYFGKLQQSIFMNYYDRVNLDDYTLVNTRLSWDEAKYSLFVDITNVFATEYKETNLVTMPGRWAKAGVRVTL